MEMPTNAYDGSTIGCAAKGQLYAARFASFALPVQHGASVHVTPKHAQPLA